MGSRRKILMEKPWRLMVFGLLAGAILFGAISPALAAPPAQEGDPAGRAAERLELLYKREQNMLDGQSFQLERAANIASRAADLIARLSGEGYDVSDLQAALDAFEASLADANASHDTAARILAAHAGFDDSGALTDRAAAINTLRSAGQALRDAHFTLANATVDLRRAILDWRQAHGSQS